jgi:hypothetical protein
MAFAVEKSVAELESDGIAQAIEQNVGGGAVRAESGRMDGMEMSLD